MTELEKLDAGLEYDFRDADVNAHVPDNCVVGGIPAKVIKSLEDDTHA